MVKAPRIPERVVQAQIVHLLRAAGARVYVLGTHRRRVERDHGTHQTAGMSDIVAFLPRGHGALFVEVKATGGRRSEAQIAFAQACFEAGAEYACGGVDEVLAALVHHGLVRDENVPHYRRLTPLPPQEGVS